MIPDMSFLEGFVAAFSMRNLGHAVGVTVLIGTGMILVLIFYWVALRLYDRISFWIKWVRREKYHAAKNGEGTEKKG